MNWDWDKLQEKRQHQAGGWSVIKGKKDDARKTGEQGDNARPSGASSDAGRENGPAGGVDNRTCRPVNNGSGGRGPDGSGGTGPRLPGGRDPRDAVDALRGVRLPGGKWWFVALAALWLASGIYIVQPGQAGVVLRFGRYVRTVDAGPHYRLPWPIEQVYRPNVSQVRQAEVGFRSQSSGTTFQQGRIQPVDEESAMLTGDENIVNIQFNIQYHIKPDGAVDYLFNVTQPDAVVKKAAEAAMREVIGKTTLDAALTDGRVQIQNNVQELLQGILDRYQVGVQVVAVQMQDVQPPREVSDAFKDVASAREDKQRLINEAEAYRRDILPRAQGQAAEIVNQAEAYRQTRVRAAEGETQRFLSVLAEYEKAPDITRKRLLYETMEDMLSRPGMEKLVLPSGVSQNVLPFLPLGSGAPTGQPAAAGVTGADGSGSPADTGAAGAHASASGASATTAAGADAARAPAGASVAARPGSARTSRAEGGYR